MSEADYQFGRKVSNLLQDIQDEVGLTIVTSVAEEKSGQITGEKSRQYLNDEGQLVIELLDQTGADYLLAHELLHVQLHGQNYPVVQFNLTTGYPELDEQFQAHGNHLELCVQHVLIEKKLRRYGFLEESLYPQLLAGARELLGEHSDQSHLLYHTALLLDLLVTFEEAPELVDAEFGESHAVSLAEAKKLYAVLMEKEIETTMQVRRALIRMFKAYDVFLDANELRPMELNQFATISGVFSERQLRLPLSNLFEIMHAETNAIQTKERAYVAVNQTDGQNTFVIPTDDQEANPEFFQKLYQQPLGEVLAQYEIYFSMR